MATSERIERFKADIGELKLKTGHAARDRALEILGLVLMVGGVAAALVIYSASLNQNDARDVQSSAILALSMLAVTVVGAALFLRYSIARFLRLWLLRQLYEGQAHAEQLAEAVAAARARADGPSDRG